jgi:hypothetical protein
VIRCSLPCPQRKTSDRDGVESARFPSPALRYANCGMRCRVRNSKRSREQGWSGQLVPGSRSDRKLRLPHSNNRIAVYCELPRRWDRSSPIRQERSPPAITPCMNDGCDRRIARCEERWHAGGSGRRGFLSLRDPTTRWSGHPWSSDVLRNRTRRSGHPAPGGKRTLSATGVEVRGSGTYSDVLEKRGAMVDTVRRLRTDRCLPLSSLPP